MRHYIIKIIYKNGCEAIFSPKAVSPGEALIKVSQAQNLEIEKVKSICVKVGDKIV